MSAEFFLSARLRHWAERAPERAALMSSAGQAVSYRQLEEQTRALAAECAACGLKRHDLAALVVPSTLDGAVLILALLRMGVVGATFPPRATPGEVRALLQTFAYRAVFVSRLLPKPGEGEWSALGPVQIDLQLRTARVYPELARHDVRWILNTSGSTGQSKAVMLDEANLHARTRGECEALDLRAGDTVLNWLSFAHDLGLNQLLTSIYVGATLVLHNLLSAAEIARQVQASTRCGITGTPYLWREFLKEPLAMDSTALRYITISGGSLSPAEVTRLREFFPHARIVRTYGQTETFRTLLTDARDASTLGHPIPGTSAELSAEGELLHFGTGTMTGYLDDPEQTAAKRVTRAEFPAMPPGYSEGIRTGDYFRRDEDGRFYFLGRRDDLIKRSDNRVSILEIEHGLREHDCVADAAVIFLASPEPDADELIAFVTARAGMRLDKQDLFRYCRAQFSRPKVPDKIVVLPELPRTAVGKVNKDKLRQMFQENP